MVLRRWFCSERRKGGVVRGGAWCWPREVERSRVCARTRAAEVAGERVRGDVVWVVLGVWRVPFRDLRRGTALGSAENGGVVVGEWLESVEWAGYRNNLTMNGVSRVVALERLRKKILKAAKCE